MCSKWSAFCFVIILLVLWLQQCDSLKIGDKGVCDAQVPVIQKQRVFYTRPHSWKKCKGKPCVVRYSKLEWRTIRKSQLSCCSGWQYDNRNDVCKPICATGCINGTCVSPNNCQCNPPLYLEPQRKNICLPPTCDPPCVNGNCTAQNYCTCFEGFKKNNSTCEPICFTSCDNGICIGPNDCVCYPGFTAVNDTCVCGEGYEDRDGRCEPKCEYCINGECTAPNTCVCYDGYQANATNPEVCYRPCLPACGGECDIDGQCPEVACEPLPPRDYTIVPDPHCKYARSDPRCFIKVVDIKGPKKLKCCDGWLYTNDTKSCEPNCPMGCVNGTCVAPETCHCEPPLTVQKVGHTNTCLPPVCTIPCNNAICISTDTCECLPKFRPFNATLCIPWCDPGFKNDPFECRPVCNKPCVHGLCTAPDTCSCLDGYDRVDEYNCKPRCNLSCEGFCEAPNRCACATGYQLAPDNFSCQPICKSNCVNGYCSSPNECKCNKGYRPDLKDKFKCKPVCEPPCLYGNCTGPNNCSCQHGYEKLNKSVCTPICKKIPEHSKCVKPDTWECIDGYEKSRDRCKPICKNECLNGFCFKPDECLCNSGYQSNPTNKSVCDPKCIKTCVNSTCDAPDHCKCLFGYRRTRDRHACEPACGSCGNGTCVAPNDCICNEGYSKIEGVCRPICKTPCVNGYCSSPDNCSCNFGYFNNGSECYKPCEGACNYGKCDSNGTCTCNNGYEKVNGTCHLIELVSCETCGGECKERCACADDTPCVQARLSDDTTSTSMAGLRWGWELGGGVVFLLVVLSAVVLQRMWARRKKMDTVERADDGVPGSVMYDTVLPHTLITPREEPSRPDSVYEEVNDPRVDDGLLAETRLDETL